MRASERLAGEVQSKKKKKRITNGSGLTQEIQQPSMECDRTRPETYQRLNINKRLLTYHGTGYVRRERQGGVELILVQEPRSS